MWVLIAYSAIILKHKYEFIIIIIIIIIIHTTVKKHVVSKIFVKEMLKKFSNDTKWY